MKSRGINDAVVKAHHWLGSQIFVHVLCVYANYVILVSFHLSDLGIGFHV
jgi:hypothetical protein